MHYIFYLFSLHFSKYKGPIASHSSPHPVYTKLVRQTGNGNPYNSKLANHVGGNGGGGENGGGPLTAAAQIAAQYESTRNQPTQTQSLKQQQQQTGYSNQQNDGDTVKDSPGQNTLTVSSLGDYKLDKAKWKQNREFVLPNPFIL